MRAGNMYPCSLGGQTVPEVQLETCTQWSEPCSTQELFVHQCLFGKLIRLILRSPKNWKKKKNLRVSFHDNLINIFHILKISHQEY